MEIKTAGRNINNLRFADDTTLMAESEELQSLLMKVKEESEKAGLKLDIQKIEMASGPITSWQLGGEKVETVPYFILLKCSLHWASRSVWPTLLFLLKIWDTVYLKKVRSVKATMFGSAYYEQKNCTDYTKKIFMTQITMMVWSFT